MKQINWFLLIIAYASLFVLGLSDNARGPVFPDLLREFSLSDARGGLFFFTSSAAGVLNNALASLWLERLGSFRALQVYSGALAVGLFVMGASKTYGGMLMGCAIFGIGMGGLGIAQNLLAANSVPEHRRRQALSGLHGMYGISSLIAPLVVTMLFHMGVLWKSVFIWIGVLALVLFGVSFLRRGRASFREEILSRNAAAGGKKIVSRPWRTALYFAALIALYAAGEVAISTRLVLFARRESGLSVEGANDLLALFFLALFLGRLLFAVVHLPFRNKTVLWLSAAVSLLATCLGLLHHPAWLALSGLTMSMFYPCAMAYMSDEAGSGAGFITSWILTAQSLALMTMHFVVGWFSDLYGLGRALWMAPLCLILVLILLGRRAPDVDPRA